MKLFFNNILNSCPLNGIFLLPMISSQSDIGHEPHIHDNGIKTKTLRDLNLLSIFLALLLKPPMLLDIVSRTNPMTVSVT